MTPKKLVVLLLNLALIKGELGPHKNHSAENFQTNQTYFLPLDRYSNSDNLTLCTISPTFLDSVYFTSQFN